MTFARGSKAWAYSAGDGLPVGWHPVEVGESYPTPVAEGYHVAVLSAPERPFTVGWLWLRPWNDPDMPKLLRTKKLEAA